ncbi:MAG: PHP domain-containing protein [Clostridia bacterium]
MKKHIDLHVHTTASDGSMTPSEVVRHAVQKRLAAIAITDHDTVEGIEEALIQGHLSDIEVIPGIEISVDYRDEMHILGYYIDIYSQKFITILNQLNNFREERNPKIIKKLNDLGMSISFEEVEAKAGRVVGRPHIARVMVEKGYVDNVNQAFYEYLNTGKPAYIERKKLSQQEGIRLIKNAGGIAILAHPIYLEKGGANLDMLLPKLIEYGLDGLEVYYSDYTSEDTHKYLKLADKYNLVATGGSDFHGRSKPRLKLGEGYGTLQVPYELLEKLKNKREEVNLN